MLPLLNVFTIASLIWPSLSADTSCSVGTDDTCQERDETSLLQVKKEVMPGSKRSDQEKSATAGSKAPAEGTVVLDEHRQSPVRSSGAVLKNEIVEKAVAEKLALDSKFPGMTPLGITMPGSTVATGDFVPSGVESGAMSGYMPEMSGYAPGFGPGMVIASGQGYMPENQMSGYAPGFGPGMVIASGQGQSVAPAVVVMPPAGMPGVAPGFPYAAAGSYSPDYAPAGIPAFDYAPDASGVQDAPGFVPGILPGPSTRADAVAARAGVERAVAQTTATVAENVAAKATVQQAVAQSAATVADAYHRGLHFQAPYHVHYHHQYGDGVQIVPEDPAYQQAAYPAYQQATYPAYQPTAGYPIYEKRYYPDDVAGSLQR